MEHDSEDYLNATPIVLWLSGLYTVLLVQTAVAKILTSAKYWDCATMYATVSEAVDACWFPSAILGANHYRHTSFCFISLYYALQILFIMRMQCSCRQPVRFKGLQLDFSPTAPAASGPGLKDYSIV